MNLIWLSSSHTAKFPYPVHSKFFSFSFDIDIISSTLTYSLKFPVSCLRKIFIFNIFENLEVSERCIYFDSLTRSSIKFKNCCHLWTDVSAFRFLFYFSSLASVNFLFYRDNNVTCMNIIYFKTTTCASN